MASSSSSSAASLAAALFSIRFVKPGSASVGHGPSRGRRRLRLLLHDLPVLLRQLLELAQRRQAERSFRAKNSRNSRVVP